MDELKVVINQEPGVIKFNFEELKIKLAEKMQEYQGAIFTEESKTIARAELAGLRKLKESVDKRRKEVKVQAMIPYTEFEKNVKELIQIIDEPISLIDVQIKEMEEKRIHKRREDVRVIWTEIVGEEAAKYLPLNAIYDKKWDNATTTIKNVENDLLTLMKKTSSDILIIRNSQSDAAEEAIEQYKKDRDLTSALTYINAYEANKKKVLEMEEERKRKEEEYRHQQEIERIRAEERRRLMEIERVRQEERRKALEDMEKEAKEEPFVSMEEGVEDDLPFVQPCTTTAFYKVVASAEELEQVEMAFNSIGIYFERRES